MVVSVDELIDPILYSDLDDQRRVADAIRYLERLLGTDVVLRVARPPIDQRDRLTLLVHLASTLRRIETIPGFEPNVLGYRADAWHGAMFTSEIASVLSTAFSSIALEAPPAQGGVPHDVIVEWSTGPIVFECKRLGSADSDEVHRLHERVFEDLPLWHVSGHQLDVAYLNPTDLTAHGLEAVMRNFVGRRLPPPTRRLEHEWQIGPFLLRVGTRVMSVPRRARMNVYGHAVVGDQWYSPSTMFCWHAGALNLHGPRFARDARLENLLRRAARQARERLPFVVVIPSQSVAGPVSATRPEILRRFQPHQYTRVSAVWLVGSSSGGPDSELVLNPHARCPLDTDVVARLTSLSARVGPAPEADVVQAVGGRLVRFEHRRRGVVGSGGE
jgi:hypothetical protein